MDQHGDNRNEPRNGHGPGAAWRNAAYTRFRAVRINRFGQVGRGLPRPIALFLTLFLGCVLLVLSLAVVLIGIALALVATPFVLAWVAVRRATLGLRSKWDEFGHGRENVVVRRPR